LQAGFVREKRTKRGNQVEMKGITLDTRQEVLAHMQSIFTDYTGTCERLAQELEKEICAKFCEEDGWDVLFGRKCIEIAKSDWRSLKGNVCVQARFLNDVGTRSLAYKKGIVEFCAYGAKYIENSRFVVEYDFAQEGVLQDIVANLTKCMSRHLATIESNLMDCKSIFVE